MTARRTTKRALLAQQLQGIDLIGEETWARLKRDLRPVSDSYLHSLLKQSGLPLVPLVEGVNTNTFEDAERTLESLAAEYSSAGDVRRKACRTIVINAKQRLRWSLQRPIQEQTKRSEKEELLLWTATWLENPMLFPDWVKLRRRQISTEARKTPH